MAKGIGDNNALKWVQGILIAVVLFAGIHAYGAHREIELFDRGYDYYLSYKPEKAVETFNQFLKEFADSTSKDAALFWLGKSLSQLQSYEEAMKIYADLKKEFPESPFIPEIDKEVQAMPSTNPVRKSGSGANVRSDVQDAVEERLAEIEKKAQLAEKDLSRAIEERDTLRTLIEAEKRKTEELKMKTERIEGEMAENRKKGEKTAGVKIEERLSTVEKKTTASEREISKVLEDAERLRKLLEEQMKKTEEMRSGLARMEGGNIEKRNGPSATADTEGTAETKDTDGTITVKGRVARIYEEEKAIAVRDDLGKVVVVFFDDETLFQRIGKLHIAPGEKVLVRYVTKGKTNIGRYIRSLAFC